VFELVLCPIYYYKLFGCAWDTAVWTLKSVTPFGIPAGMPGKERKSPHSALNGGGHIDTNIGIRKKLLLIWLSEFWKPRDEFIHHKISSISRIEIERWYRDIAKGLLKSEDVKWLWRCAYVEVRVSANSQTAKDAISARTGAFRAFVFLFSLGINSHPQNSRYQTSAVLFVNNIIHVPYNRRWQPVDALIDGLNFSRKFQDVAPCPCLCVRLWFVFLALHLYEIRWDHETDFPFIVVGFIHSSSESWVIRQEFRNSGSTLRFARTCEDSERFVCVITATRAPLPCRVIAADATGSFAVVWIINPSNVRGLLWRSVDCKMEYCVPVRPGGIAVMRIGIAPNAGDFLYEEVSWLLGCL
jgi:hypothetical protein